MQGWRVVWPERAKVALEEFTVPEPGPRQVLVETEATLISPGTERAFLLGLPNTSCRFPTGAGYNQVGWIAAVGAEVTDLQVGDRVASTANHASHAVLSADRVLPVPEGLTSEQAVFFNLGGIALQGIRKARLELGEAVLVLGQGLIGLLALQVARLSGGFPVIGADVSEWRLQVARRCGADEVLNPQQEGFAQRLAAATGGGGPAVVIEATGHPEPINTAFRLAAGHGRVVLLGSTRGETEAVNFYRDVHRKGLTILGAHNSVRPERDSAPGFWTWRDDAELMLNLLARGRFVLDPLITHRLPAAQAPEAYQMLLDWKEELLGVVLKWK
ncbi:MAG TPA: zinc-binding alcohol dehydrogenase [Armatimonadetes bacterium]|nr:zinc-binding alcohol dehydrogenase [Armatimonadota bacterium]